MIQLLEFLIAHGAFLLEPDLFSFAGSHSSTSFGDASITLGSDRLLLRFVRDRGQLFLDFQGASQSNRKDWYSIDVVQQLVTGVRQDSSVVSPQGMEFVREHLAEIRLLFDDNSIEDTHSALKILERKRAKALFD